MGAGGGARAVIYGLMHRGAREIRLCNRTQARAETLARELELFRVKVTASRSEVYESWRERDHDDLVLALALACWAGTRPAPRIY